MSVKVAYIFNEPLKHYAQQLGVKYAVFGSGSARSLLPDVPESREALEGFVKDLGALARQHGLTVVIEPLRKRETNVFVTVPETGEAVRVMNAAYNSIEQDREITLDRDNA